MKLDLKFETLGRALNEMGVELKFNSLGGPTKLPPEIKMRLDGQGVCVKDPDKKSISLLEHYLSQNNLTDNGTITTFRALNRLRQGYPVHGDRTDGVLKAYRTLGVDYPVEDFSESWKILLGQYLDALENLLSDMKG